jgi:transposase-like protein
MFPVSYRDLESMLLDRGVEVDHTTIFRWIQAYAAELEKRIRPHLRLSNGSWRVDETYVRVKGRWTYLYRAVDSRGQTIDFLLSAQRDTAAAKRFFRKAVTQPHTVNPRTITVDKNPAYPKAVAEMKRDGELWRRSRLRQCKYLTDVFDKAFPNRHGGPPFFKLTLRGFRPDGCNAHGEVKAGRKAAARRARLGLDVASTTLSFASGDGRRSRVCYPLAARATPWRRAGSRFQPCRAAYDRRTSFVAPERPFGDCCFQFATNRRYSSSALPVASRSLSRADLLL